MAYILYPQKKNESEQEPLRTDLEGGPVCADL